MHSHNSNLGHFQYAVIKSKQSHTFNVNATCWFVLHGNTDQNGSLFAGDVRGRLYTLCGGDSSTNVLVSYDDGKLTITNNINLFPNNGKIPDGTDFNSLLTVGKYFVVSDDRTLTMTNVPEQVAGRLFVLNMLGDEKVLNKEYQYFIQIYLLRTGTLWMRTLRRENDGSPIIFDNWVKRW